MSAVAESVEPGSGALVMSAASGLAVADRLSTSVPVNSLSAMASSALGLGEMDSKVGKAAQGMPM